MSNNAILTMFADDTTCHRALQNPDDNKILQSDLDKITDWCHETGLPRSYQDKDVRLCEANCINSLY